MSSNLRAIPRIGRQTAIEQFVILSFCAFGSTAQCASIAAVSNLDGNVTLYTAAPLTMNQIVLLQHLTNDGELACCIRRKASDFVEFTPAQPVVARLNAGDHIGHAYKLRMAIRPGFADYWALAATGTNVRLSRNAASALVVTERGKQLVLQMCTGSEGINVVGRSIGKPDSHLYVAVGYDIDASATTACREGELPKPATK